VEVEENGRGNVVATLDEKTKEKIPRKTRGVAQEALGGGGGGGGTGGADRNDDPRKILVRAGPSGQIQEKVRKIGAIRETRREMSQHTPDDHLKQKGGKGRDHRIWASRKKVIQLPKKEVGNVWSRTREETGSSRPAF